MFWGARERFVDVSLTLFLCPENGAGCLDVVMGKSNSTFMWVSRIKKKHNRQITVSTDLEVPVPLFMIPLVTKHRVLQPCYFANCVICKTHVGNNRIQNIIFQQLFEIINDLYCLSCRLIFKIFKWKLSLLVLLNSSQNEGQLLLILNLSYLIS